MDNPGGLSPENWNNMRAVQDEITRWATETFPHRTDHHALYKLVLQEVPELLTHKKEKGTEDIGTELADCFILLLDLASLWEVDVVDAIRAKMAVNYARKWTQDENGIMQHIKAPPALAARGDYNCPKCCRPTVIRELTVEERIEARVQWGNQSDCPFDSVCLECQQMFDSTCPF